MDIEECVKLFRHVSETLGASQGKRQSNVFFLMPIVYNPASWRKDKAKGLQKVWSEYINGVMMSKERGYNHSKFSSICLPVQVEGNWLLLICDMRSRRYSRVIFNNWEY